MNDWTPDCVNILPYCLSNAFIFLFSERITCIQTQFYIITFSFFIPSFFNPLSLSENILQNSRYYKQLSLRLKYLCLTVKNPTICCLPCQKYNQTGPNKMKNAQIQRSRLVIFLSFAGHVTNHMQGYRTWVGMGGSLQWLPSCMFDLFFFLLQYLIWMNGWLTVFCRSWRDAIPESGELEQKNK